MQVVIKRETLLVPLQLVAGVVGRRQTVPVLANLLLDVTGDALKITGSDNEIEIGVSTTDFRSNGIDATTVSARKLLELWRNIPPGTEVELDFDPRHLTVSFGRFRSSLATIPAYEFPLVTVPTDGTAFSLPAELLRLLIDRARIAMAQQDVRYFLNGMLFEVEAGSLRAVATNGQRLASTLIPADVSVSDTRQFIIPAKGIIELARVLASAEGEIKLHFSEQHLLATAGQVTLISSLIDGKYPDYKRAIPADTTVELEGNRRELRDALVRTAILSNEIYHQVVLALRPGELVFRASNPLQEEAEEVVNVVYDGDEVEMAFNLRYLLDAMDAMEGDRIRLQAAGPAAPALLTDPADSRSLFVVSPMII
ncbi:MAG: DNA polymerase III subunit beta [Pseudomonadota bacterium]